MALNKKNLNNLFYIFVTAHLIIWTLVPTLTNNNLPLDTIEHLAWGSNLDWGFDKHPPMVAVFLEIFYQIFGSQDWSYYFLSQLFVIISFYFVFRFSNEIFANKTLSLLSVFIIEAIYFYNFTTPEFNVNVCQLPFWSLVIYYSWKIYESKDIKFADCFLVGLFGAAGFLSKYLFSYLLVSVALLFFYLILIKKLKKFDFKYLITIEIFLVLLVPHIIWLFNNDFITVLYGLKRTGINEASIFNHFQFPLIFLLKQIVILIPFFFLIRLLIKKVKIRINFNDKKILFLIFINILPIFLMFLTSVITGSKIRTMWMTPFYLFFGTLLIYIFQNYLETKKIKNFLIFFIFIFLLSPISYGTVSLLKDNKRTDYPGKEIAMEVEKKWNSEFKDPINVVLGDEWTAGNLSYHLKSRPVWEGSVDKNKLDSYNKYICLEKICVGVK